MKEAILILVGIMNDLHDLIAYIVNDLLNWNMTDKDLHFWVMGAVGFTVFLFVLIVSYYISKLPFGITILAFLYTFTFMIALVFAIEIQQAITNRGQMEFADAVVGLYGYLAFFFVFALCGGLVLLIKKGIQFYKEQDKKGKH